MFTLLRFTCCMVEFHPHLPAPESKSRARSCNGTCGRNRDTNAKSPDCVDRQPRSSDGWEMDSMFLRWKIAKDEATEDAFK